MRPRLFDYAPGRRIVSELLPLALIVTLLAGVAVPGWALINGGFQFPADSPMTREGYLLFLLLGVPLFLAFALLLHLMYPAIHVREDGFRLETRLYKSAWLPWSAINGVRSVGIMRADKIIAIQVDEISPIYSLVAFLQVLPSRAFLVHATIRNEAALLKLLRARRGDLFVTEGQKKKGKKR